MTYVIGAPCIDVIDKACVEVCPVDCIYEGGRMMYIHPDECVDCGACDPVCPVQAIVYEDELPDGWETFRQASLDVFHSIGAPGGARKLGVSVTDLEQIASMPSAIDPLPATDDR
jgi:NAD-dependent dihydropyrimidine dehydrogenase PreA subunit